MLQLQEQLIIKYMANTSILTNLDLNNQELLKARVENLPSAPALPEKGKIYFDTTLNRGRIYNGTVWLYTDTVSTDLINDAGTTNADILSALEINTRIANAISGSDHARGGFDASAGLYPSAGTGSGTAGEIKTGDNWFITVAGTIGNKILSVGDGIYALINTPAQTDINWGASQSNLDYTAENVANKVSTFTATPNDTNFPTEKLVKDSLDLKANKITLPTTDNLITQTSTGDIADSGVAVSTDGTFNDNSDLKIPTEKAIEKRITDKINGTKYAANFASTDFTAGVLTILQTTHLLGATTDLSITVRDNSKNEVWTGINVATNGDVTISVNVGLEFNGRIIITA